LITHELFLATLADEPEVHVVNVHFRDHVENGKMVFDYKLRSGVVDTTNALRVRVRPPGSTHDEPC
jgi:DNA mismatch repair ATPase MutS